jgi:Domain of unknown function (DUF4383)
MELNAKTAGIVIGAVFVVVGLLGFVPNPLVSSTGLFAINTAHNLIHLLSGAAILACAFSSIGAGIALKIFGVVYALVAVLGLIMHGDMLLGFIRVNHADHWLHVLLAVVILAAAFMLPEQRARA